MIVQWCGPHLFQHPANRLGALVVGPVAGKWACHAADAHCIDLLSGLAAMLPLVLRRDHEQPLSFRCQRATVRNMVTRFDRRHPYGVILIRVLVTGWLLALTGILLAYGYWGWALLTISFAVVHSVWAYRVYRATKRSAP